MSTDTRTLRPGCAFVALRGERFDGHDYLAEAAGAGSPLLIVDRENAAAGLRGGRTAVLLVDDAGAALARLARAYRRTLRGRVIAVTGSVGKTTTKRLIHAALSARYTGSASPKSYNNHIGVPLTILAADPNDAYLVVEVGTNAPGEIAALARIVEPDIAVITAIAAVHLAGLGCIEGVLREKASLLSHLRPGGLAVVNGDAKGLAAYRRVAPAMLTYGRSAACHLRMTDYRMEAGGGSSFEVNDRWRYRLNLLGEHNALNAMAALAVARHMHMDEEQIAAALASARGPGMRLEVRTIGDGDAAVTIINDAYNANPASVAAALETLRQYPSAGRRIAVLGDMLELGEDTAEHHRAMGEAAAGAGIDRAVFIGPLCAQAAAAARLRLGDSRVEAYEGRSDAAGEAIAAGIEPGDTVLVKGSRAMKLERLLTAIEHALSREPQATAHPATD